MAEQKIKTATASDEASVIAVMLLAFGTDPAARWTWPDPQRYLEHFPKFVETLGGKAIAHGGAHCIDGYAGAALWLPPGVGPEEEKLTELFHRTAHEPSKKDALAVFEQMGSYHPQEPHWFLPFIGVDPSRQPPAVAARGGARRLRCSAAAARPHPVRSRRHLGLSRIQQP